MGRDANDILQEGGPDAIAKLLAEAKPYTAKGKAKANSRAGGAHAHDSLDEAIDRALDEIDAWLKKPSYWESEAEEQEIEWLVMDLLPAAGAGLLSGQWGMFKTFVVLDLSVALAMGTTFAGRLVHKKGGVLVFAVEGAHAFPRRLRGLREAGRLTGPPAPIVWRAECPTLLAPNAADIIVAIVEQERAAMKARTGQDLVAVVIDTIAATAGWSNEQDNAEGQRVMNVLREVGARTGCLAIGVDHFGKVVESGTRGGSAKEAAGDFVLALLGTRDINGKVSDCKLAVRKMRDGETGIEIPFEAKLVEMTDAYGITKTTCIIDWQTEPVPAGATKAQWTRPTLLLRQALETALAEHGQQLRPFGAQGDEVCAVDKEIVRKEFYASVNVDPKGDKTKQAIQDAKRKAFNRAIESARAAGLIGLREIHEAVMMWVVRLGQPQPTRAGMSQGGDIDD